MSSAPVTNDQLIDQRIDEAARALWWGELIRTLLAIMIGSMVAILAWLVFDQWVYASGPLLRSVSLVGLIAVAAWFMVRRVWPVLTSKVTHEYAAWALEQGHSDYRQQLTSYVTLKPDAASKGLRARIVKVLGSRAAGLLKTHDELPAEATGTFRWWIAAAAVFAVLMAYIVGSPKSSLASATRLIAPLSAIDPAQRVSIRDVEPGDADALAGRSVAVSARVDGLRPDEPVYCRWVCDGGESETELIWDTSTGLHRGEIELPHSASGLATYRLEAGDALAGPFRLDVENVPVVAIDSVYYEPPQYTGRKARTVSSPSITVVDGTKVTIRARTNRAVARAEIQFNPKQLGDTVRATAGRQVMSIGEDGKSLTAVMTLRSARGKTAAVERESYRIRVWDGNEQANPEPIVYPIRVIPDLPPEVAIVVPQKSPIEVPFSAQQIIEVHAMDADFELQEVSLRIDRGIDTLSEPLIWLRKPGESGRGNQVMEFRFRPAEHRLNIGDTVRVTAIALDNREIPGDSSVEPNRSVTDPVEIRIVEDQSELPEDPSANDGLSRPDDRPASDVDQSDQSESGQGSEQSGGGSGQQSDSSSAEGSGQQGEGAQESGTSQQGEEGGSGQQGSSSDNSQSKEGMPPQEGDPQQSDPSQGSAGESSGDSSDANSGEQTQPGKASGAEDAGKRNPNEQPSGERNPGEQNAGQENTGNQEPMNQGSASDGNASESGQSGSSESGGTDQAAGQSTGEQGAGSDSNAPPKHDGEAFERIKDFVENKRRQDAEQQSKGGGDSAQEQQGATEQKGNDPNSPEPNNVDSERGDRSESQNGEGESSQQRGDQGETEPEDGSSGSGSESEQTPESRGTESQQGDSGGSNGESSMEERAGNEPEGEPSSNGEGTEPESGQSPSGQQGQSSKGDSQQGEPQQGEPGAKPESGEQEPNGKGEQGEGSDNQQSRESGSEGESSEGQPSGEGSKEQEAGDSSKPNPKENGGSQGESSSTSESSDGQPSSNSSSQNSDSAGQPSNSNPSNSDASSGDGNGTGSMPGTASDAANEPPPPDLEYAKEATDMVLDYLDETREQVDPKLLEDLNWTEKDLQRFRQRWQKVRELEQAPANSKPSSELEDALKSLGLKPKTRGAGTREAADGFRSLRDSGNRRKAPAAFRDAFDAFRSRSKE